MSNESRISDDEKDEALKKFNESAENLKEEDIFETLKGSKSKIENLQKRKIPGPLQDLWDKIKLMFRALRAYYKKEYRELPWGTIAALAAGLLYFVSPVDVVTDFIPVLGYVDDAVVLGFCLKLVDVDLKKYEQWETREKEAESAVNEAVSPGIAAGA